MDLAVGMLLCGWPLGRGLEFFLLWYCTCVTVEFCMTYHHMGVSLVLVPLCHMGRPGFFSELVSVVLTLGLWLLDILLLPSDVLQVPEALSWQVVIFLAMVVLVLLPLEVELEVMLVLGARPIVK